MPVQACNRQLAGPFVAAALILAAGFSGAADAAAAPRAPETVYAKTCGYCHGQHVAPIIRGRGIPVEVTKQYVRTGPRGMVAFRPTEISDAELEALAKWLNASKADAKEKGE
jgi:mono/diheme cytochrome c family protein